MRLLLTWCKCDGEHPICGRCKGYGHTCNWPKDKKDTKQSSDLGGPSGHSTGSTREQQLPLLQLAIRSYDNLIASIQSALPESARSSVNSTLSQIRGRLPMGIIDLTDPMSIPTQITASSLRHDPSEPNGNNPRYLGEASDVRFFHTIKKILRDDIQSGGPAESETQSYDQEILHLELHEGRQHLPAKDMADAYIEIYFSTIHIAYPFLNKPSFMARYERFWTGDKEVNEGPSWLPLLCKLLLT
ncbi:MAG: hypothetical protein CL912_18045 [Deltaproteobacteria bacterium]|nr:hypothetical protein [Deltaproteobacteria bacterium]